MKVWLLLSRLGHGGLERVQLNIAKALHAQGIEVSLVAGQVVADVQDELPEGLPVVELAKAGPWYFPAATMRGLRRMKPDVVFTTSNDVACLLLIARLLFFRKMRVIVTQHLALSAPRKAATGLKRAKLNLICAAMRLLLPTADEVVAVSDGVALDIKRELSLPSLNVRTIYNPIVTPDFQALSRQSSSRPWKSHDLPTIIFVGRLSPVKRLDLLLDSFQSLVRLHPSRLLIIGSGPLQSDIEHRIKSKGLSDCAQLMGFVENPLSLIAASDVLVLPSDYEGFGNVLVEAMACGTQVIATDCPFGPAEILSNGRFGQLIPVNDARALEAALKRTLLGQFHVSPESLKARAQDFTVEAAASQYLDLIFQKKLSK